MTASEPYLTLAEAAAKLRKSPRWLWDWLDKHPIDGADVPFYRIAGRTRLFGEADVERMRAEIDLIGEVPTFIYFVEMEGHIKIGRSDNWRKRVSSLQTSAPFEARLLLVLKATNAREKELHGLFAAHHVRGEWFKDHPELRLYIKRRMQWNVHKRASK